MSINRDYFLLVINRRHSNNLIYLIVFLCSYFHVEGHTVKHLAIHAKTKSNLQSATIVYTTSNTSSEGNAEHIKLESMEDFLESMIQVGLIDSTIFYNHIEHREFIPYPPSVITSQVNYENKQILDLEILKYPIGYSIAVYTDLTTKPSASTPLLWTRGLHKFETFDAPYSGHIAFIDGSVGYFEGKPGNHDPNLIEIFTEGSHFSTTRILEHVPEDWNETTPLPILYAESTKPTFLQKHNYLMLFIPGLIGGLLAMAASADKGLNQSLRSGVRVFLIITAPLIIAFSILLLT